MPLPPTPKSRPLLVATALLALGAGLALPRGDASTLPPALHAGAHKAADEDILRRYEGFTRPSRQVMLGAPLDGVLLSIGVREGQSFGEGDTLAGMDDAVQVLAVEIAKMQSESNAAIDAAQAREDEAQVNLERQRDLASRPSSATSDLDVRRAEAEHAEAVAARVAAQEDKAVAEVQYRLEQARLERYKITAPFDGRVVRLAENIDEGASLRQADPVMQVVQLDPLEATINLPAALKGRLTVGSTYRLSADRPIEGELRAVLVNIDDLINPASQTVRYTFEIENPGNQMQAGFKFRLASLEAVEE